MVATINKPLAIDYNILMFLDHDLEDQDATHHSQQATDDALVVKVQISNALVSSIMVNNCSRVRVLFNDATEKRRILDIINKEIITLHTFNRVLVQFLGIVKLKAYQSQWGQQTSYKKWKAKIGSKQIDREK